MPDKVPPSVPPRDYKGNADLDTSASKLKKAQASALILRMYRKDND